MVVKMLFAGVDIGSTTSKCYLIDENKNRITFAHIMTEFNRDVSGEKVLREALTAADANIDDVAYIVSTGYGRKAFKRADKDIPEIIAHAVGTNELLPGVRTIIDIGGQDSKVIGLDEHGAVDKFEMNDKCAAGTGRFFEVLTHRLLGIEMDELSDLIIRSNDPIEISSMCTIFAESEIISHLSVGTPVEDIAAGTGYAIARRIVAQGRAARIKMIEPIVFSGGAANNEGIRRIFEDLIGQHVTAIGDPQCTAALGAAIKARGIYLNN
jgi:predicted CoA-substrate-specific enzyme activase